MQKFISSSVLVPATPATTADMFWNMDCDRQAAFFNLLGDIDMWKFVMQLQYVTDSPALSAAGRRVMSYIGEYSEKPKD